jgi:hypothetical protein
LAFHSVLWGFRDYRTILLNRRFDTFCCSLPSCGKGYFIQGKLRPQSNCKLKRMCHLQPFEFTQYFLVRNFTFAF